MDRITSVTPIFSCPCKTNGMHTIDWLIRENSSRWEEVENDCLVFTYLLPRKYVQVQATAMVLMNVEGKAVSLSPVLTWFRYKPVTRTVQSRETKIELDLELAKMATHYRQTFHKCLYPPVDQRDRL